MSRGWCFTSFAEDLVESFREQDVTLPTGLKYLVGQVEECPETGRLHVQGFARCTKPMRRKGFQNAIGDGVCNCRPQRGTFDQARAYCTKEESRVSPPVELGERDKQGARNDLLGVKRRLEEGASLASLFSDDELFGPVVKHHRGLLAAQAALNPPRERPSLRVYALIGPSGTGKSRHVQAQPDVYTLSPPLTFGGAVWWDGYAGQQTVALEDYEGWLPWPLLLRILDRYAVTVQTKGGMTPLHATTIWLTSNKSVTEWHPKQDAAPLLRRITRVVHAHSLMEWEM